MTRFLLSFPSRAMEVGDDEWETVNRDAHAVVDAAKGAGVWVFGGGLDEGVEPVRVAADGTVARGAYPEHRRLTGGFAILDVPGRADAEVWAARFAGACRCPQEIWQFMYDPEV